MARFIFTKEEMDYISENIDTIHYSKIAKTFSEQRGFTVTPRQVSGKANNMGLKQFRPKSYKRRFFETIDANEKAYWLGFIYADGWITQTEVNAEVGIELAQVDRKHLVKFATTLEHPKPDETVVSFMSKETVIKKTGQIIKPHPSCKIRLYSQDMVKDLIKENVVLRKTYSLTSPDFKYGDELNWAFLRGYFDGDGSLDHQGRVHFTAYSDFFLVKLKEFLESQGIECYRVYYENEAKTRLMLKEKHEEKFLKRVYQDPSFTYLERKYNLFKKLHK